LPERIQVLHYSVELENPDYPQKQNGSANDVSFIVSEGREGKVLETLPKVMEKLPGLPNSTCTLVDPPRKHSQTGKFSR
jgi:hypothetical protein